MHPPPSLSAATLLYSLTSLSSHRFSSNCPALDSLLTPASNDKHDAGDETGLPRGGVLELIGPPGIGKSRTAMAFALAEAFKAEAGQVLVIGESTFALDSWFDAPDSRACIFLQIPKVHSTRVSCTRLPRSSRLTMAARLLPAPTGSIALR